jgi:hypothetical protein
MRVKFIRSKGKWREIANSCNTTINKSEGEKEPSSNWKRRILMAEHSPIRQLIIKAKWYDLKSYVSVHIVRHWLGVIHWVRTQRTDRTGVNREQLSQSELIEHEIEANAQANINISRKRLCSQASKETREAWQLYLDSFKDEEPELYQCCVKECIYRGFCPEFYTCGYHKTPAFEEELREYRKGINE